MPSGTIGREFLLPGSVRILAAHPHHRRVALLVANDAGVAVVFVATDSLEALGSTPLPLWNTSGSAWSLFYSADGRYLFAADGARLFRLAGAPGGDVVSRVFDTDSYVSAHPHRDWVVGVGGDRASVVTLDQESLAEVSKVTVEGEIKDHVVASDGSSVVAWKPHDYNGLATITNLGTLAELEPELATLEGSTLIRGGSARFVYRTENLSTLVEYDALTLAERRRWNLKSTPPDVSSLVLERFGFLTQPVTVVEYHHATLDRYFITADQVEIDALDHGLIAGWQRTGETFGAMASDAGTEASHVPMCRFYGLPERGLGTHFYSASRDECDAVEAGYDGAWVLESRHAFYVVRANTTTGACPEGTSAIYRLWSQRPAFGHRYTTSPAIKAEMIARGFVSEGYGPDGVAFCGRR